MGETVSPWVYSSLVATFWFNEGARQLQSGGSVVFLSDTIKARVLEVSVAPDINDAVMTGYTGLGTDATLGSKTVTNDTSNDRTVYSAATATIVSPGTGDDYEAVVVYKFVTDDSDSIPLFCLAVTPGTTDGTDLTLALAATGLAYSQQ